MLKSLTVIYMMLLDNINIIIFQIKTMEIKILGTGCPRCKTLEKITREVVNEMGIIAEILKEEDIVKIMNYGIMHTPGLVINDKVVVSGYVPSAKEIKEILIKNQ